MMFPHMWIAWRLDGPQFRTREWNNMRYYDEAVQKGDEVSAKLAMDKLEGIYQAKAFEIITEAVQLYKQETDQLPSTNMNELVAQGYVQRVIAQKMGEDENFAMEVYPVLFPTDNAYQVLHSLQGNPVPAHDLYRCRGSRGLVPGNPLRADGAAAGNAAKTANVCG